MLVTSQPAPANASFLYPTIPHTCSEQLCVASPLLSAVCEVESGERLYITLGMVIELLTAGGVTNFNQKTAKKQLTLAHDKWISILGECPQPQTARAQSTHARHAQHLFNRSHRCRPVGQ